MQLYILEPFRQAGINISNVPRGPPCQNFKQDDCLHASPSYKDYLNVRYSFVVVFVLHCNYYIFLTSL